LPNFFFKRPPLKLFQKLWPLPTIYLKKLPLKMPKTFFFLFIINSRISIVSLKLRPHGSPMTPFTAHAPFGPYAAYGPLISVMSLKGKF